MNVKEYTRCRNFDLSKQSSVLWPYNAEKVTPWSFQPLLLRSQIVCELNPLVYQELEVLVRVLEKQKIFLLIIFNYSVVYNRRLTHTRHQNICTILLHQSEEKKRRELKNN